MLVKTKGSLKQYVNISTIVVVFVAAVVVIVIIIIITKLINISALNIQNG